MVINDQKLALMIKENRTIEINGEEFRIIANKRGSCDGCYFSEYTDKVYPENNCPILAVTICCSNGGNIFEKVEKNGR